MGGAFTGTSNKKALRWLLWEIKVNKQIKGGGGGLNSNIWEIFSRVLAIKKGVKVVATGKGVN
jgi:hypothetical protein